VITLVVYLVLEVHYVSHAMIPLVVFR